MINITEVEIKVYPLVLESDPASALWHLIRALDKNSCGKVSFTLAELLNITGYTKSTVYRYMQSSLFHKICKNKTKNKVIVYTFYYKSLKQVATTLGISNLITSSFCMWNDIKHFYTKRVTATEIIAMSIQARSKYIARKVKNKSQHFINIDSIFSAVDNISDLSENVGCASDNTQGVKLKNNQIFYSDKNFKPYGASQETIANVLTRNIKTINKRLKNTPKVQQFISRPYTQSAALELREIDRQEWTNLCRAKYLISGGKYYERYTNLYSPSSEYCLKIKKLSYNNNASV